VGQAQTRGRRRRRGMGEIGARILSSSRSAAHFRVAYRGMGLGPHGSRRAQGMRVANGKPGNWTKCFAAVDDVAFPRERSLQRCNASFVPFGEQQITIYIRLGAFLFLRSLGLAGLITSEFRTRRAAVRECLRLFRWRLRPKKRPQRGERRLSGVWTCIGTLAVGRANSMIRQLCRMAESSRCCDLRYWPAKERNRAAGMAGCELRR
jgi:hypothetical protein